MGIFEILKKFSRAFASTPKNERAKLPKVKARHAYVDEVATELRQIARRYEDPLVDLFFSLGDLQIVRTTKARSFQANAYLRIAKSGFRIDYRAFNSRAPQPQVLSKKWNQTIGVLPNVFELYLRDHSMIEFVPTNKHSYLLLSVFWQVFHDVLNGGSVIMSQPVESGLGHRLREVSNYLVDNRELVGESAAFSLSKVPTNLSREDFGVFAFSEFPEIGDKIQDWRLVSKLGEGGFGAVFKARHIESDELAAIKLMSPLGDNKRKLNPEEAEFRLKRQLFLNEAPMSMKVSSPFVVSAVDVGENPWPWILYPLVTGAKLTDAWNSASNKTEFWWNLAHDLVSALHSIHTEGLLHKDVKLDNILAAEDRFVLLDFGIGEVQGYEGLLLGQGISGTYGFLAPELVAGNGRVLPTESSDVFAAGVTLLSLIDPRALQILSRAKTAEQVSLLSESIFNIEGLPSQVSKLVGQMVSFDPARRSSSTQLLEIIAPHVDLQAKLRLIDAANSRSVSSVPSADSHAGTDESFETLLPLPINSWGPIEVEIKRVIEQVRPNFFIVELGISGPEQFVYVQGLSGAGGWVIEAMSENFSDLAHDNRRKTCFVRLGWTPPSGSEPNYSMNLSQLPTPELVRRVTDAFEFGYEIKFGQINRISIKTQGTGKY